MNDITRTRRASAMVVIAFSLVGCGADTRPVGRPVPRNPNGTFTNPRTNKIHKLQSVGGTVQGGSGWSWNPTDGSTYSIVEQVSGTTEYREKAIP